VRRSSANHSALDCRWTLAGISRRTALDSGQSSRRCSPRTPDPQRKVRGVNPRGDCEEAATPEPSVTSSHRRDPASRQRRLMAARRDAGHALLVLDALAEHVSLDGTAHPSRSELMQLTGLGKDALRSRLDALTASGLIEDTGLRVGQTKSVIVWLLPDWVDTASWKQAEVRAPSPLASETSRREAGGKQAGSRRGVLRKTGPEVEGEVEEPPVATHPNSERVARALREMKLDGHTHAVFMLCHQLNADPWEGYLRVKHCLAHLDLNDPTLRDPIAVLRCRASAGQRRSR
jgi:hypothetical protein